MSHPSASWEDVARVRLDMILRLQRELAKAQAREQRVQRALAFWHPGVRFGCMPEVATKRAADDAMLLLGLEEADEQSAADLGWIAWVVPGEFATLRRELAEVTADRDMARASLDKLQQQWAENEPAARYKRELAARESELSHAALTSQTLERELTEARDDVALLNEGIADAQDELGKCQQDALKLQDELAEARAELAYARSTGDECALEVEGLQRELAEARTQRDQADLRGDMALARTHRAETELAEAREALRRIADDPDVRSHPDSVRVARDCLAKAAESPSQVAP